MYSCSVDLPLVPPICTLSGAGAALLLLLHYDSEVARAGRELAYSCLCLDSSVGALRLTLLLKANGDL